MTDISIPEAKKDKKLAAAPATTTVVIRTCPMFDETYAEKVRSYPIIKQKFLEFVQAKVKAPLEPFGSKDKGGARDDPMRHVLPSIKHAHLNQDISVFYAISGSNPTNLDLFGIFTHDDVGQGQPSKPRIQRSAANRLQNQLSQLKPMKIG